MILRNLRAVLWDGIRDGLEVVIENGLIAEIRPEGAERSDDSIDLRGSYLAPGFVDLHVHGALGRDTMEASGEAFRAICRYHATGGTTSLLLTTATAPVAQIVRVLKAARGEDALPQIAGVHLEGPFISKAKPGAQRAEFIRAADAKTVDRLLKHGDIIRRVTIAPEIPGALEAIEKFARRGIAVSGGHSDAWEEEARAGFARGMSSVTHTFNCMSTMRRRGLERVAGLLEFALSEPNILCELIADGHHVSPTLMKMLYRAKSRGGICLVTDATAGAGLPDGTHFSLAGLDCVVAKGVCLLADRSALAGSAARMIDLIRVMVAQAEVPLHEAVGMASEVPARAIGLGNKGRLKAGADADLAVLSPELKVERTFLGGKEIFSV